MLVHLWIDTVQLQGDGFRLLAAEGDEVTAGTPLVEWDTAAVEAGGPVAGLPVIALDARPEAIGDTVTTAAVQVEAGARLFIWR